MYSQLIKVQCNAGQEAATRLALDKYLKAARLNPGFIHGSSHRPR